MGPIQGLDAGRFSSWLYSMSESIIENKEACVPCGECTACCRSSLFVHIRPEEINTLASIPKELQFPAPGLPKGYLLLGYDSSGNCPMLMQNKCSIYENRPITCRAFDCRIFSATGIMDAADDKDLIGKKVQRWRFSYETKTDIDMHSAVQSAAKFLCEHQELFPAGFVPPNKLKLAVLAIIVYPVFLGFSASQRIPQIINLIKTHKGWKVLFSQPYK